MASRLFGIEGNFRNEGPTENHGGDLVSLFIIINIIIIIIIIIITIIIIIIIIIFNNVFI